MKVEAKIEAAKGLFSRGIQLVAEAYKELDEIKKEKREASNITLSSEQAARILGVTPRTVFNMKKDGRLKSLKYLDVINHKNKGKKNDDKK